LTIQVRALKSLDSIKQVRINTEGELPSRLTSLNYIILESPKVNLCKIYWPFLQLASIFRQDMLFVRNEIIHS